MEVSLFNDNYKGLPFKHISIDDALNRIKSGYNIKQIERLRKMTDKKQSSKFKVNELWSVTFAGTFTYHKKDKLIKSSQLAILDFDAVVSPSFFKQYIFDNYYHVFAAWISPSGTGVKALIKIPEVENDAQYKEYYNAILKYFDNASADESTKDISRYAFESYDPDLLQRDWDKVTVWQEKLQQPKTKLKSNKIKRNNEVDQNKLLNIAANMINNATDGQKHFVLLKASRLLGGYIEGGNLDEQIAVDCLETAIQNHPLNDFKAAQKTIMSGLQYGKLDPIYYDFRPNYEEQKFNIEFPIDIFPDLYQKLIAKLDSNLNFPRDYTATAIIYAYSVILGNRFKVHVKNGYETVPICWFGIVGEPGVTKSHPINKILKPITDWDYNSYVDYKKNLKEWEEIENNRSPRPIFKKFLIDDFTTEALPKIIKANKNGVGIYADELASWVDNLDRYGSGNSMAKFLSIYDNGKLTIDRKTLDPEYVKDVFLSIIGTIQPQILLKLFEKFSSNGFFDRFLFAFPETKIKPLPLEDIEIPEIDSHESYINIIISQFQTLEYQTYYFENMQDYININRWLITKINSEATNERMSNYISKLNGMIPRLAIIIETINSIVVNGFTPTMISTGSMVKTFDLIKYFFTNAEKLLMTFSQQSDINAIVNGYKLQSEKVGALRKQGYKFKEIGKHLGISAQVAQNYNQKLK